MNRPRSAGVWAMGVFQGVLAVVLVVLIVWASLEKSVMEIFRVMLAERWGVVTLIDLYGGFVISGAWICVLERRAKRAVPWLVAMFCLGNLATGVYVLWRASRARTLREAFIGEPPEPVDGTRGARAGA